MRPMLLVAFLAFVAGCATSIDGVSGPRFAKDLSLQTVHDVPLAAEVPGLEGYAMRARFGVIAPGGRVPLHQHRSRPAFTYILSGRVVEFRNGERFERQAGDITVDSDNLIQHFENPYDEDVRFYIVDLHETAAGDHG